MTLLNLWFLPAYLSAKIQCTHLKINPMVEITPSAQAYLLELLSKQEDAQLVIEYLIADPGTPLAETCIAYCRPGEEQPEDERIEYEGFPAWIDDRSQPFLVDALVDYAEDRMGGQLTIKAPNSKVQMSRMTARLKTGLIMYCIAR